MFPSLVILSIRSSEFSTSCPFLSAKRSSGLFWEYSSLTFALILSKSSLVISSAFDTTTLSAEAGVLISYFLVCAFNTKVTAPGSVLYDSVIILVPETYFVALFAISTPSVSVAVAKRVTRSKESSSVFGNFSAAIPETCPVTLIFAGVAVSELIAVTV